MNRSRVTRLYLSLAKTPSGAASLDGPGRVLLVSVPETPPRGWGNADFDADGIVDAADLAELLSAWGPCG